MGVDWQHIGVTIHLKSSLHLGRAPQAAGEYLFTQQCIPGAALRGALAGTMIRNGIDPEGDAFQALFQGPGGLRFEPAYPVLGEGYSFPFPLTAHECKLKGGFKPPKKPATAREKYHGVFDTLAAQFVFEQMLDEGKPLPFIYRPLCPHCGGSVQGAKGSYGWSRRGNPLPVGDVRITRTTHTAINRARGVAEDGMLYTVEAIQTGTTFRTTLWVPRLSDEELGQLKTALTAISRLGRGTSRGRGRVEVTLHRTTPSLPTLKQRIQALTDCIEQERAFYHTMAGLDFHPDSDYYFTLDLLSPAILGDGVISDLRPSPESLVLPKGVKLVRYWTQPEQVGGWWTVAGLPYPTALAAAAGSAYLYRIGSDVDLDVVIDRLKNVQAEGIGRERERGYGAVLPCAPFHTWTEEREKTR
jgi:CRISPR-associated Csx10 family RAMP protein